MEPDKAGRWQWWAAAGLIAVFLVITFAESRWKSPSSDEPPHIAAGLSYFVTHEIFRADPQHPPLLKELSALSLMAAGIRWPHTPDADYLVHGDDPQRVFWLDWKIGNDLIRAGGPDRVLFWARLPMILMGALLAALVFVWGRQLFGSLAALGATLVCVLDPVLVAHSQFVTTDVGVAAFTVLALAALWNYLRRPDRGRLLLCGLSLGAALSAKYSALALLPAFGLLMLAALRWPLSTSQSQPAGSPRRQAKADGLCACGSGRKYKNCHGRAPAGKGQSQSLSRKLALTAGTLGIICLVAFLVIQATFFFPRDLLMYKTCAEMVNADHDPNYLPFMAGELQKHYDSYFVLAYLLKEPLAAIALAVVGLAALLRSKSIPVLGKLFLLVPAALFFVPTTIMADDIGVRYIMPVLPFAYLLAGLGLATLIRTPRWWARVTAAVLCGWLVVAATGIYPDHLSYFNEAACLPGRAERIGWDGGSRCGIEWLDDSNVDWGQGFKQLKLWLDRNAAGRTVKLATSFGFPAEAYGIRYQTLEIGDLMKEPTPGLYAVSAHLVARVPYYSGDSGWLRRERPVAIVGHAFYIYEIPGA